MKERKSSSQDSVYQKQNNPFVNETKYPSSQEDDTSFYYQFLKQAYERLHQEQEITKISRELLEHHRVRVIDQKDPYWEKMINEGGFYMENIGSKKNGLECTYQCIIGKFYLYVKIINLHRNSEDAETIDETIGKGAFGVIKRMNVNGQNLAIKKLFFSNNKKVEFQVPYLIDPEDRVTPMEIRKAVKEYCIYKICSMLGIGPKVIFSNVYDLVCYNDCIEFYMELCHTIQNAFSEIPESCLKNFDSDLKYCLAKLHSVKFIHKDIKPENTLFSPSFNRFVFTDFGVAHSVRQRISQKSHTYFEGSHCYASNQMKSLFQTKKPGFVNLYLNDFHALRISINQMESLKNVISNSYDRNSLSAAFYDSFGFQNSQQMSQLSNQQEDQIQQVVQSTEINDGTDLSYQALTKNSCNEDFIKFPLQINFYQMKVIYEFLNIENNYEVTNLQDLEDKVDNICVKETNKKVINTVKKLMKDLYFPEDSCVKYFIKVRNSIRIFGLFSDNTQSAIKQILQHRPIPYLNYKLVENMAHFVDKYKGISYLKKFDDFCLDLNKGIELRNNRSLITSICYHFRQYLISQTVNISKKHQILNACIRILTQMNHSSQDLQIIDQNVSFFLDPSSKPKKNKKKEYEKNIELIIADKIFLIYQNDLGAEAESFDNLVKFYQMYRGVGDEQKLIKIEQKIHQMISEQNYKNVSCLTEQNQVKYIKYLNFKLSYMRYQFQYAHYQKYCNPKGQQPYFFKQYFLNQHDMEIAKQLPNAQDKLDIYQNFYQFLWRQRRLEQAEYYNELSYEIKKQIMFPRTESPQVAYYFFNKANILSAKNQFLQSIPLYQKALSLFVNSLQTGSVSEFIISIYKDLAYCYNQLNNKEEAIKNLQSAYEYSLTYKHGKVEKSARILDNILRLNILSLKPTQAIYQISVELVIMKINIIQRRLDRSQFVQNNKKNLPFFHFQPFSQFQALPKDYLISVKKSILSALSTYLPYFKGYFSLLAEQIGSYYLNELKKPISSLPYLWEYFQQRPKCISMSPQSYKKMQIYAQLLIRANSSRRAFKFLKNNVFSIPQNFSQIQFRIFQKMAQLSRQLNRNDKFFYERAYKFKAFESRANSFGCKFDIQKIPNIHLKYFCLKKLRAIQIFFDEYCDQRPCFIKNTNNQEQTIQRDNYSLIEQRIARKSIQLFLKKTGKQQILVG